MKILIVGSDTNSILFAQYIKAQHPEHDLYLSSEDVRENSAYTAINIRENDIAGIIDFVKYNAIEFTVVFSTIAIVNGIADVFRKEEFPIFAPLSESAKITLKPCLCKNFAAACPLFPSPITPAVLPLNFLKLNIIFKGF